MKVAITVLCLFLCLDLYAKKGNVTNLDLPRYVSLKSDDANLRVGPSVNYPIKLKYIQQNLPIKIIDEFDVWRKTKDHKNNIGWIHKSLIQGNRFVLILTKNNIAKNIHNRPNGKIIGKVENNNILTLESCLINWCFISHKNLEGWLSKENLWGVYEYEVYNQSVFQPIINQFWKILDSKILSKKINFE